MGVNIGPNKDTKNRINDYLKCLRTLNDLGDYITINISSPNTEKLRDFHNQDELSSLIKGLKNEKNKLNSTVPIAVKVSPDLNDEQIDIVSNILLDYEIEIVIVSNTSDKNRDKLNNINKLEKGGLSGKPLNDVSNNIITDFYKLLGNRIKIIGVGGVDLSLIHI